MMSNELYNYISSLLYQTNLEKKGAIDTPDKDV